MSAPAKIATISDYHQFMELPKPQHPLISVVRFEDIKRRTASGVHSLVNGFYSVALKKTFNAKMVYGQQEYDFQEGILAFISPNQVISVVSDENEKWEHSGWLLIFHPDFLWNTPLAKKIRQYDFFDYKLSEALHLSDKEERMITDIIQNIDGEYNANIDKFSQDVIIAQLELLLTYSERFYDRQFITRKISNHGILERLEILLDDSFTNEKLEQNGLPTVQFLANNLNLSPNYLSNLLKTVTGQSTQQHIHDKLVCEAKEKLSTTKLSVSEIAYKLGFEHPQSFSKFFKTKTTLTPLAFRQSFQS